MTVDLARAVGLGDRRLVYAFTYLHVAKDTDAILWIGHDDDCRVFVDGTLRHDHHFHERKGRDAVALPLKLAAGTHHLLLKVANRKGAYGFSVRIGGADGRLAPGLLPSLRADGADLEATALAQPEFFSPAGLLATLPLDSRLSLNLTEESDMFRLALFRPYPGRTLWFDKMPEGKVRLGPSPGARVVVALHPWGKAWPARIIRRMRIPKNATTLRVRVCADAHHRKRGRVADGRLRLGVFDGAFHWIADRVIGPHATPSPANWTVVEGDLIPHAGKEALVVIECASGGRTRWWGEDLYVDSITVQQK